MLMLVLNIFFIIMIFFIGLIFSSKNFNKLSNSSFECGFSSLSLARLPFSIQFFLITIIFLIFDVELVVLTPLFFFLDLSKENFLMIVIIWILLSGLYLEWMNSYLEWSW